jgi:hypothetical protein
MHRSPSEEAVDAYVAVLPRDYYTFSGPPPQTPVALPIARLADRSRFAKLVRWLRGKVACAPIG